MRNDNHVPIVVAYLGIEVLSALLTTIIFFECQYLSVWVQFFCTCNELPDCGILHYNHRFTGSTQTAHFHCRGDKRESLSATHLMRKHKGLHRTPDDSPALVRSHSELMRSTSKKLRYKLIGYAHRHIVIEHIVIYTFHTNRHFRVALHFLPCPILEVPTDFVNLGGARLCRFLVGYGLCRTIPVLFGGRNSDTLICNGRTDKRVSHNGSAEHFTGHAHGTVLFVVGKVWLFHKPSTAYCCKPDIYFRSFLYEIFIQFRINPRTAEGKVYQVCGNIHGHDILQCLDVAVKLPILVVFLCLTQFFTHVSALVTECHFYLSVYRVFKAKTAFNDFFLDSGFALAKLFDYVWHIHTAELEDTGNDTVLDIGRGRFFLFFNHTSVHHVRLAKCLLYTAFPVTGLLVSFNRRNVGIIHIMAQKRNGGVLVEVSVCAGKIIVCLVEFIKQGFQPLIAFILSLIGKDFCKGFLDSGVRLETFHFRMPLYLVGIHFERLCTCSRVDIQLSVFHKHFANLLAGY